MTIDRQPTMTVGEAKQLREDIVTARNKLNEKIRIAKDAGVFTELEIREISRERVGQFKECYYVVDVTCTVDPSRLK